MYFCCYFALTNGPNWEVICIIPISVVILIKKWVFNPLADHILDYWVKSPKLHKEMIVLPTKYPKMRYYMTLCVDKSKIRNFHKSKMAAKFNLDLKKCHGGTPEDFWI